MLELRLYQVGATATPSWSYGYTKLELRQHQVEIYAYTMLELRLNPFGATAIQSWCYSYTKLELRQHQVGATATLIQVGATNIKSWSYTTLYQVLLRPNLN